MSNENTTAEAKEEARFGFGRNWGRYLALVDDERIAVAEQSLRAMLERESLEGLRFLDVGSGSGLFSLAARKLGATVHSFDYDPESVGCTRALREHYRPGDTDWTIERGARWTRIISVHWAASTSSIPGACSTTPGTCGVRWAIWCRW